MAVSPNLNLTTVSLQAKDRTVRYVGLDDSISQRELLQLSPELCCQTSLHGVIGWGIRHAVITDWERIAIFGAYAACMQHCCPDPAIWESLLQLPGNQMQVRQSIVHHLLDYDQMIRAHCFTTASAAQSGVTQATNSRRSESIRHPFFVSQRQSASHDLSSQA